MKMRHLLSLVVTVVAAKSVAADSWPEKSWEHATADAVGLRRADLERARDYALSAGGSGTITRHGKRILTWGDLKKRYDLKSTSKSIGVIALGIALADGKLQLNDKARTYHLSLGVPPESNAATGWLDSITILHLATQTAGFEKRGGYEPIAFPPGTKWHYSDGGPNWLAECLTLIYKRDLQELLFERIFTPIGIGREDLRWRKHAYRPHEIDGVMRREFGSGVHANVDAMARLGLLYLRGGRWKNRQLLPASFVNQAGQVVPSVVGVPEHPKAARDVQRGTAASFGNASNHYGLLWWNNADGSIAGVPKDTYWSWGLYDSLIVVFPSLDMVVSRTGRSWKRTPNGAHYEVLKPFLQPLAASARPTASKPPYEKSPVIRNITWAPADSIQRFAHGSDNWPLTWADDDHLYTAYGDGWGFQPRVEKKLSMGFARIVGDAEQFRGENIRSDSGETVGQGAHGKKASGILMVDGTLYLWVRNAGNSQLLWSPDRGKTWRTNSWRFETSFGCPTFLNFGRNYDGARDEYVYVYSHDSDTAYEKADRMVLARVHKKRILELSAYEFFVSLTAEGTSQWTKDIRRRGAVFDHPRRCYRSGITYNAGLKRYLWCQILPESRHPQGVRFQGGFGIYDAPEPWGPWTTVEFTNSWDVGPGETSSLPTKWMSADGKSVHLVFSGDDYFSIRQATLELAAE